MATAGTINSIGNPGVAGNSARRDPNDGAVRSDADAFAAMLDATRQTVQARTLATTRESPAQMFEAKGEPEPHDRKGENSEPTTARFETPPVAQESPAAGSLPLTNPEAVRLDASKGGASAAMLPPQSSTDRTSLRAVPTTLESVAAPSVNNEASSDEPGSEFAPREHSAEVATSGTKPQIGAAANVARTAPAVPNGTSHASSEATLARTLGEALGAKVSEPVAVARSENSGSPSPSGRPTVNQTTKPKLDPSAGSEASKPPATESDNNVTPFERLVRSLRMQVGQRYSTARLRLNPPELGEMRVDVHLRGDEVELEVRTTDEAARRIVAGRAEELRSALEQGGVTVRRFDVMVDETMAAALPRSNADSRAAETSKRKSDEAERESEGRAGVRGALSRRGRLDVRG